MIRRLTVAVCALGGAAAVVYGLWLAWEPLAFIVAGLGAMAVSYLLEGGDEERHDDPNAPR